MLVPPPPPLLTLHFYFPLELYVFLYQLIILWTISINWHRWLLVNNHISKYNSFILVLYRRYINYTPPPPTHTHFLAPSCATANVVFVWLLLFVCLFVWVCFVLFLFFLRLYVCTTICGVIWLQRALVHLKSDVWKTENSMMSDIQTPCAKRIKNHLIIIINEMIISDDVCILPRHI